MAEELKEVETLIPTLSQFKLQALGNITANIHAFKGAVFQHLFAFNNVHAFNHVTCSVIVEYILVLQPVIWEVI